MPRRTVTLALTGLMTSVFASGCACERPFFPRLNCLFGCRPALAPVGGPLLAPPVAVGPQYAPPPAHAPAFAPQFAHAPVQPGCVGCDAPPGGYPVAAGVPHPAMSPAFAGSPELPLGAIPIGAPVGMPPGVPPGAMMSEPHAALPPRGPAPGLATGNPTPMLLPPPAVVEPLR